MSSTSAKAPQEDDGPYLSFNPKITTAAQLGPPPSDEELEQMKKADPKLQYTWVIWEQHKQSAAGKDKREYSEAMRETVSFGTVKEFWGCWNHLPQPSELLDGKKFVREADGQRIIVDALAIFRKGVKPEWEDPQNENGGHFQIALKPQLAPGLIDELWNNIVLGMVSGAIEPSDMLTGVRLVDKLDTKGGKSALRVEVWFNEYDAETASGGTTGKVYELRGNFERCMKIGLDGSEKQLSWGRTETKPHNQSQAK